MSARPAAAQSESKTPLVLVVDDDALIRVMARNTIEKSGMRVAEAEDGIAGLELFQRLRPDIILLDVMMPRMDGFDACAELRSLAGGASAPVLMMTGLSDSRSIERAYQCGATDFITKPISWPILGHRLRYLLRSAQLTEDLIREISERKRAEQALRLSNADLEEANQQLHQAQSRLLQSEKMASIGQLAAGVAHEINTPIGFVNSNLGALERYLADLFKVISVYESADCHITDPDARARIVQVKQSSDLAFLREDAVALMGESREGITRVKKIVLDLRDFSHSGADDQWQLADVHRGLDSTLNIANSEIRHKAQVIRQYGDLPQIDCLPSQLNQVFMNLLVNAAQAVEGQGSITLRTGVHGGDEIWVEIIDTGTGIAPEHIQRIFDPFFTTKPVGEGTGLGLSLSYSIVQKHKGRIEVESEVGKGTVFRVTLPVKHVPARSRLLPSAVGEPN